MLWQAGPEPLRSVRRIPLSPDAAGIALGHFLELTFGARHLYAGFRHLERGHARYLACGSVVACFSWEPIAPASVDVPPPEIVYSIPAQQAWLRGEVEELVEVRFQAFILRVRVPGPDLRAW